MGGHLQSARWSPSVGRAGQTRTLRPSRNTTSDSSLIAETALGPYDSTLLGS
jgi:hypothetical protein